MSRISPLEGLSPGLLNLAYFGVEFSVALALVALTAASSSASADELVQNLGPVGPHEP
jgi:hypothetical protein